MLPKDSLSINFTGDVSFTGAFKKSVLSDTEVFEDPILDIFKNSDFNVVNLEGPTSDKKTYFRNDGLVVSPYKSISYLKDRNISIFNLANNHLFDNGLEGYKDSISAIQKNNGLYFGGGLNLDEASKHISINANGISIAMIGVCHKEGMIATKNNPGIFCIENNFKLIKDKVAKLKQNHDWVLINYHGGEEYTRLPMPSRKKLLRKLSTTKTDIVIAHHSHVFQGYETYKGKLIFYSLGNFVFDIPPHKTINFIELSAILNFTFTKNSYTFKFHPTVISVEKSKICSGSEEFNDTIKSLSKKINQNYFKNWLKEANRAFFSANKKTPTETPTIAKGKRHQSLLSIIFQKDTLFKFIKLLRSNNKRPLFFGAILHKLLNR